MNEKYTKVAERAKELMYLNNIMSLSNWDQEVMMPKEGINSRSEEMALLSGIIHEKTVDPKMGDMLRELNANKDKLNDDRKVNVREWLRGYEKAVKIPGDLVKEITKTVSIAQNEWAEARKESNFKRFSPHLKKLVELKKKEADALGYEDTPYNALLDDFEPYTKVKDLDPILENLRNGLVPVVKAISESKQKIDQKFLTERKFAEDKQEEICKMVSFAMGLTKDNSRLDRSTHPFCTSISNRDIRITTRYAQNWMPQALYGVIHESGHSLYELGFEEKNFGTPLAQAVSMGIHESQSRFWENYIGRSYPFMKYIMPKLKEAFPKEMSDVSDEMFYKAVNKVEPSFIRVEADEVTYNLHIIIRYEIEKAIINGSVKVDDLPNLWNQKMEQYLGIKPKNDAEGVLQDIHWSMGAFGYFPSYLLGNLYASQIWNQINKDIPDMKNQIEKGDFKKIREWLRINIHIHGKRYKATELIEHVTHEPPNSKYIIDYFKRKFGEIYDVKW